MIVLGITINTLIYNSFIQINTTYSSNIFPTPSPFLFFWDTNCATVGILDSISYRSLRLCSFFLHFYFSDQIISTYFHVCWFFLTHYWNMLLSSFGVFFTSVIVILISKFLLVSFFGFLSLYWYFLFGETSFSLFFLLLFIC